MRTHEKDRENLTIKTKEGVLGDNERIFYKIVADYYRFWNRFNRHHFFSRNMMRTINRKKRKNQISSCQLDFLGIIDTKKRINISGCFVGQVDDLFRGDFSIDEIIRMINISGGERFADNREESYGKVIPVETVDLRKTIKVRECFHNNFNAFLGGNLSFRKTLDRLGKILSSNDEIIIRREKKIIIGFMFYVAVYCDVEIDKEKISTEIGRNSAVNPQGLMRGFGITCEDIIRYLEDNFFYPDYKNIK